MSHDTTDTILLAKTLEVTHQPAIRVSHPVLDGSTEKVGSLLHDPAHGRQDAQAFVATPTALSAHVKDVISHPDVHGPKPGSEDEARIAEFKADLEASAVK